MAGSSVTTCDVSGRHILALESEQDAFEMFLKGIEVDPGHPESMDYSIVKSFGEHLSDLEPNSLQGISATSSSASQLPTM